MKTKYIVAIAVLTAILTTLALVPKIAHGEPKVVYQVLTVEVEKPSLTVPQILWLARLMQCESGLKGGAVNPNDVDNTPSYGVLQFKPSTFTSFAGKYGITGELMDEVAQVQIVEQWLLRPGAVRWENQFPACVRKLGVPPVVASSTGN